MPHAPAASAASAASSADASQTVRFVLDGRVVSLERPAPTMTVLEYLREVAGRCGTKEGCAEGDCGACTVVLGELTADRRAIAYRAVNSCIRFLPTLDGKELVTVESLHQPPDTLHPVQQSMVDHHASQCGFCTPGFVMSLFAVYLDREAAQRDDIVGALAGNLCRCTGYRPIIDAGLHQWDYPPPARWSRADAHSTARVATLRSIARDVPTAAQGAGTSTKAPISTNAPISSAAPTASLHYPGYHAPRSVDELAAALAAVPDSTVLAGGTDVGLWVTKQLRDLPALVYLGDVPELTRVETRPAELWIGAAVTLTDAWPAVLHSFPELKEQCARFASPPIRNSATLCGNLANGSPIGDSIPAMLALGAHIELRRGTRVRRLPLEEFYLDYQKKDLHPGEFVTGVAIPAANTGRLLASYKLAKRIDQDISAVCATFCVGVEGARVHDARLAFGGMAGIACRARRAEAALRAGGWTEAGIEAAIATLAQDFTPLTDFRASREYRLRTAGGLLRRFYREHSQSPRHASAAHALRTADALDVGTGATRAPGAAPEHSPP